MKPLIPFLITVSFITLCALIGHCQEVRNLDALRDEMRWDKDEYDHDMDILNPAWIPGNDPETRLIMDRICHEKSYVLEVSDPVDWE